MFVIRNMILNRLVTNGKREPLVFTTIEEANTWLRRNGYPQDLKVYRTSSRLTPEEQEQLLKVNIQ